MKNGFTPDTRVLQISMIVLTLLFSFVAAQAQTPIPSPSPAPTPITKPGSILVSNPSTVGRITKWVGSSSNGIGTIGDSVIRESSIGTVGIGTNPFSDFKLAVDGGSFGGLFGRSTASGTGVFGSSFSGMGLFGFSNSGTGVFGQSNTSWAGFFQGSVNVTGPLSAGNLVLRPGGSLTFADGTIQSTAFSVNHDSTLTGNGSSGSPLSVVSVPNGVVTTGSYANPSWITSLAGIKLTGIISTRATTTDSIVTGVNDGFGNGVFGFSTGGNGVHGHTNSNVMSGVYGRNPVGTAGLFEGVIGVYGKADPNNNPFNGPSYGVRGESTTGVGVSGSGSIGMRGESNSPSGHGVMGINTAGGDAGFFDGKVTINGNLNVTSISANNLSNIGAINTASNPVDWSALKNVPSAVAAGQVVNSVNGLSDNVTLAAGDNVTITPSGNTLTISASASGQAAPELNPLQLATLRWYDMNEAQPNFIAGTEPLGVAFDGANMWVVNFTCAGCPGTVSKLRLSDGMNLGTFNVGSAPVYASFDGSNIWVGNRDSGNVTKLRASDGALLGTFPTGGTEPQWNAFDGSNVWVANGGSSSVTKLRANDGLIVATYPTGTNPSGVVFDGTNIWIANFLSNNVTKLRASDGANQGTFSVGAGPVQMVFDGTSLWVSNLSGNTVTKLRAGDGATLGTFNINSPHGIAFDGTNIWVVSRFSNKVTKLRASDGAIIKESVVGNNPWGIAFDGLNMWISVWGQSFVTRR